MSPDEADDLASAYVFSLLDRVILLRRDADTASELAREAPTAARAEHLNHIAAHYLRRAAACEQRAQAIQTILNVARKATPLKEHDHVSP